MKSDDGQDEAEQDVSGCEAYERPKGRKRDTGNDRGSGAEDGGRGDGVKGRRSESQRQTAEGYGEGGDHFVDGTGAKQSDREVRFDEGLDTLRRYHRRRCDGLGCVKVAQFGVGDGYGIIRR